MRFSDAPLWWRVLVIAITLAILWAVYAFTAWIIAPLSTPVLMALWLPMMAFAVVVLIVDFRRRSARRQRNQTPERRNPPLE